MHFHIWLINVQYRLIRFSAIMLASTTASLLSTTFLLKLNINWHATLYNIITSYLMSAGLKKIPSCPFLVPTFPRWLILSNSFSDSLKLRFASFLEMKQAGRIDKSLLGSKNRFNCFQAPNKCTTNITWFNHCYQIFPFVIYLHIAIFIRETHI